MIYVVLTVLALAGIALVYALAIRPWLKTKGWAKPFFSLVEPLEAALFQKSETILVGRLLWVASGLVTAYDALAVFMSSLDLTPVTTRIFDAAHIPPDLRGVVTTAALAGIGLLINWLRKRTTKPLEVVAVKSTDLTREAAQAIAAADVAKENAVAAVQEAKAA